MPATRQQRVDTHKINLNKSQLRKRKLLRCGETILDGH